MRVLFLGPPRPVLYECLAQCGDIVVPFADPLDPSHPELVTAEFILSYGYRHILRPPTLQRHQGKAINLHISMLPWNRGADPNLWSFLENTPKGVTIHLLDEGIDTGPILYQERVSFSDHETLNTAYEKLSFTIENLFCRNWPSIRSGTAPAKPQPGGGSYHRQADKRAYQHLLSDGWDTPITNIFGKALVKPS